MEEALSHFFYYDKSRNGKKYFFANVICFCYLKGQIQQNPIYELVTFGAAGS